MTARPQEHTSGRPWTWTLVHAEPGALVYAAPALLPIRLPVRRAQASRWVPQGTHAPRREGPDAHKALHYVEYLGLVGVLAAALGVGAALAGQSALASAEPTDSDSATSTSANESSAADSEDSPLDSTAVDESEDARISPASEENDDSAAISGTPEEDSTETVTEPVETRPATDTVTGLLGTLGLGPVDSVADPVTDTPTFQVTGGPADGTVTIAPDAAFTYDSSAAEPAAAPTELPDTFTVTVSDPRGDTTTVQVNVPPEPQAGAGTTLVLTDSDGTADAVHVSIPTDPDDAGRLVVHSSTYPAEAARALTVDTTAVGRNPQQVAVNPVLPRLYVANKIDKTVTVIDSGTGTVVATIPVGGPATAVAVTPDGTRAYVSLRSYLGKVVVIDTATNTVVTTVRVGSHPTALAVSPDGARLYVANSHSHTVSVIDTATDTTIDANPGIFTTRIRVGAYPSALALSADGTRLYVANSGSNSVSVINTATFGTVDANPGIFSTRIRVGSAPSALAVAPRRQPGLCGQHRQ